MDGRTRGKLLREDIFKAYEAAQTTRRPNRIRPSELGHPCTRALWYAFRWSDKLERFQGRLLRLFDTGHSQEDRMIADLRRVGANVLNRDPEDGKQQIGIEDLAGHMKGFLDAMGQNIPHALFEWTPTECKTHSAKSFKALDEDGVEIAKPQHFSQVQLYCHKMKLNEALYIAVNKDNDDIYCEFVPYNKSYAERLMLKADQIAFRNIAPTRIHKNPDFYVCKMCRSRSVCHMGELPARNCRNCVDATATKGGWHCGHLNKMLDLDDQARGCHDHRYMRDMVAGELIETDGLGTNTYKLNDGSLYLDRGPVGDTLPPTAKSAVAAE